MKKVLILVVSSEEPPYGKMIQTSLNTWDSVEVEGVETIYYCGKSIMEDTEKVKHFPVEETLHNMGYKALMAFEWALQNKDFDYVVRVNSSCYVDKRSLVDYVQRLPENNLFEGVSAPSSLGFKYLWGGAQYIISKDVIKMFVNHKHLWNHNWIEDESMSIVAKIMDIPFSPGNACSINKTPEGWTLIYYGKGESCKINSLSDFKKIDNQYFYRVKHDGDRSVDEHVMKELFKKLN